MPIRPRVDPLLTDAEMPDSTGKHSARETGLAPAPPDRKL